MSATAGLLAGAAPAAAAAPPRMPVLDFEPCAAEHKDGFQCAMARRVPLDYDRPRGPRIRLAVIRHRATDRARPVGTLFFNPGGPGAPGTDVLPSAYDDFPAQLRARFDLVSWDPRLEHRGAVLCERAGRGALRRPDPGGVPGGRGGAAGLDSRLRSFQPAL